MKSEFVLAFNEIIEERSLSREIVLEALQAALASAYRRSVNASNAQLVEASFDMESGKFTISAEKEVVDSVQDDRTEVLLEDARKVDPEAEIGSMVIVETTPKDFGRVAAQTARQVIQQRIREAERDVQLEHYSKQVGEIISGVVQAVNPRALTLGLDMKAEGVLLRKEQIPGERFHVHDRVRCLLLEVKTTPRGPQILLTRAHRKFLRRLLENEVPEIYQGLVEIRSIAREPGHRSKVAVAALQAGVDPVGACVGIRGVRIQAIVRELHDEKIDVIEWNPDPSAFIAKALSPARVQGVYLQSPANGTKTATVVVPEDQLSLAIGRDGQNARLAAKLTSWRIDIKSLPEAVADALYKLQNDQSFAELLKEQESVIPQVEEILAKKAEGRAVTPEEYKVIFNLVDAIERFGEDQQRAKREEEDRVVQEARAEVPDQAFDIVLDDLGLSPRLNIMLTSAGYLTIGELMLQMKLDSDKILKLDGLGPKSLEQIENNLANYSFEQPEEPSVEETQEQPAAVEEPVVSEEETVAVEEQPQTAAEAELSEAAVQDGQPEAALAEETEPSLEEMFTVEAALKSAPSIDEIETFVEEEPLEEEKKKKKKKKKKFTEIEYDPDADVVIARKKRKGSTDDWDEDWNF